MTRWVVLGMGRSGRAATRLLESKGFPVLAIDQNPIDYSFENQDSESLQESEWQAHFTGAGLILSPGIPRTHFIVQEFLKQGLEVKDEIDLALEGLEKLPIIGITGTNGKTTTTMMIGELLKAAGKSPVLAGNIGLPLSEAVLDLKFDTIVLELSSFQLETINKLRLDGAAILNLTFSHGERYSQLADYAAAKYRIVQLLRKDAPLFCGDGVDKNLSPQQRFLELPKNFDRDLGEGVIRGEHNKLNFFFAEKLASTVADINQSAREKVWKNFSGAKYRCEWLAMDHRILINDAKSTNFEASKTALNSFDEKGRKMVLILGGQLRGENDSILPHLEEILGRKGELSLALIGESGQLMAKELISKGVSFEQTETIEEILHLLKNSDWDYLLFSPAFPSFDQFKNYLERGECFENLAKAIYQRD